MFQLARENSNSDLLCIINADMILMPDFVEAAKQAVKLKDQNLSYSANAGILILLNPLEFTEGWQDQSAVHGPWYRVNFIVPQEVTSSSFPISSYQ